MRRAEPDAWTRKHNLKPEVTGQGCAIDLVDVRNKPHIGPSKRTGEDVPRAPRANRVDSRTRELVHIDDAIVERMTY